MWVSRFNIKDLRKLDLVPSQTGHALLTVLSKVHQQNFMKAYRQRLIDFKERFGEVSRGKLAFRMTCIGSHHPAYGSAVRASRGVRSHSNVVAANLDSTPSVLGNIQYL